MFIRCWHWVHNKNLILNSIQIYLCIGSNLIFHHLQRMRRRSTWLRGSATVWTASMRPEWAASTAPISAASQWPPSGQCHGMDCINAARLGSKYCFDQCGLTVAYLRSVSGGVVGPRCRWLNLGPVLWSRSRDMSRNGIGGTGRLLYI